MSSGAPPTLTITLNGAPAPVPEGAKAPVPDELRRKIEELETSAD